MRRILTLAIVALLALALMAPAVSADSGDTFDLTVMHRINGEPFDLPRDLPVDVYVNGALAIEDFRLADTVRTSLPAGTYDIEVKLAGTGTTVLSLMDAEIPAGADVKIMAKRTGAGFGLAVNVK